MRPIPPHIASRRLAYPRRFALLAAALLGLTGCAAASKPVPPGEAGADPWDSLVSQAIQAALLSNPDGLTGLDDRARELERAAPPASAASVPSVPVRDSSSVSVHVPSPTTDSLAAPTSPPPPPLPHLVDQLRLLALLAQSPPLPTAKEAKAALSGAKPDEASRAIVALLKQIEPRSRLSVARKTALYVKVTGPFNAIGQTTVQLLQGQLFALVDLTASAVESIVQYPYPNPEEREVLRAERDVMDDAALAGIRRDLSGSVESGMEARRQLARLQAMDNADRARRRGDLETALWWVDRARRLVPENRKVEKQIQRLSAQVNNAVRERQTSLTVSRSQDDALETPARMAYAGFLRACVEDPAGEEASRLRQEFLARYPYSPLADEMRLNEVAACRSTGRADAGRVYADLLARDAPPGPTRDRALLLTDDPRFAAPADFDQARARIRSEWRTYLVYGERPARPDEGHITGEASRRRHAAWLRYLSPIFITDMAGRLIMLPFGWPLDHEPTLAAVARWTPPSPDDPQAAERARRRAGDLDRDGRHVEAERAWLHLSPPDAERAAHSREKAAKIRLRRIKEIKNPAVQARELEKLVNAFPDTAVVSEAREALAKAEERLGLIVEIPREELVASPSLRANDALDLPDSLLDGDRKNGEIDDDGVAVLEGNRIRFRDRTTEKTQDRVLTERQSQTILSRLDVARRPKELAEGREKARRLYRIPLQLEATAMPGFEASPGFVPPREGPGRPLYE